MKNILLKKAIFVILCLFTSFISAQITLTSLTAEEYVEKLIGQGIAYSNVSYVGSPNAIRSFENGASGGLSPYLESGIVLSTGSLVNADVFHGPSSEFRSTSLGQAGFVELTLISGVSTKDGVMLQFDFVPVHESIKIKFQFGSEEYNEWVNTQFNDVFAFFISGPGIEGEKNIALVPFTEDRVMINTVNNGKSNSCGSGTNSTNPYFYIDNCEGVYNNCIDGFTSHLIAFSEVIPNETYTIKLMLADGTDSIFDTWVFLQEEGIFSEEIEPLPDNVYTESIPTSYYTDNYEQDSIGYSANSTEDSSECWSDAILSVEVPEGYQISNLKVEYTMTSYNGALATEQRSMLYSTTLDLGEDTVTAGSYNYPGEEHYSRDVNFANGATGTVDFVLKAWRTYGTGGCNSDYSYVNENTWVIIPEFEPMASTGDFQKYNFSYYPNPISEFLFLNANAEITEVNVFNIIGQKLEVPTFAKNTQIDLSGLSSGNYLVQVKINESVKTFKIVRQ